MTTNWYIPSGTGSLTIQGTASYSDNLIKVNTVKSGGISPILYFKYVKKKFKLLERVKLDRRLKSAEKAFLDACENGQEALGEKILLEMVITTRESCMYAKGVTKYIDRADAMKFKRKIEKGHISDTKFKEYTRIIPKEVLKKKKSVEECFDDFVVFHYWNEKADDVKNMSLDERAKMRDPILFGIIRETDRLYFVADWEDSYCDLTFSEMVDVLGKDKQGTLKAKVNLKHFKF